MVASPDASSSRIHIRSDLLVGAGLADGDWPRVLDARLGPAVD
jgi:hypothetical protein